MSENETSIREALREYWNTAKSIGSDAGAWSASEAEKALDALLSEHRAALKALRKEHQERMLRGTQLPRGTADNQAGGVMSDAEDRVRAWIRVTAGDADTIAERDLDAALADARLEALSPVSSVLDVAGVPTDADEAEMGRLGGVGTRVALLVNARDNWKAQAEREGGRKRAEMKALSKAHAEHMLRITKALDAAGAPTYGDCSEVLEMDERVAALAADLRRDVETTRAAALNEAATACDVEAKRWGNAKPVVAAKRCAERIRALITTPAPATIPMERVREVGDDLLLTAEDVASVEPENPEGLIRSAVTEFARRLGVDLDAKGEKKPSERRHWLNDMYECSPECPACQENISRGFNPDGTAP